MAKAQQKRVKKELEKLWRAGRHLEWLAAVEGEPRTPELEREINQAWREVARRSLRTRQAFDEFCSQIERITVRPESPEVTFLLDLRALMAGDAGAVDRLRRIDGLPPHCQVALDQVVAALAAPPAWAQVEERLGQLAREPEKASRKRYHDLAALVADTPLEQPLGVVGEAMAVFRKLNHKTSLRNGLSYRQQDEFQHASRLAAKAAEGLPSTLRQLLLLPLAVQLLLHLRQREPAPSDREIRTMLHDAGDILPWGLGDALSPELRTLLMAGEDGPPGKERLVGLDRDFAAASLEGRLVLLRDLRHAFHREASRWGAVSLLLEGSLGNDPEPMQRLLIRWYGAIVEELTERSARLAPMERRALAVALDRPLSEDARMLYLQDADPKGMAALLLQTIKSSCMGPCLAMMAALIASHDDNRRLASAVAAAFPACPMPTQDDLRWFFDRDGPEFVRSPAALGLLFDRLRGSGELARWLADTIWNEILSGFIVHSCTPSFPGLGRRSRLGEDDLDLFPAAVLRGLAELAGRVEELASLQRFLAIFPNGRIQAEGLRQWFDQTWSVEDGGALFFRTARELIATAVETASFNDSLMDINGIEVGALGLARQALQAAVDVLREQAGDFGSLSLAACETLVGELFPLLEKHPDYGSLLIRVGKALASRVAGGDTQFLALRDQLEDRLLTLAKKGSGRKRPPKKRKQS